MLFTPYTFWFLFIAFSSNTFFEIYPQSWSLIPHLLVAAIITFCLSVISVFYLKDKISLYYFLSAVINILFIIFASFLIVFRQIMLS